jgi:hypothetical protein
MPRSPEDSFSGLTDLLGARPMSKYALPVTVMIGASLIASFSQIGREKEIASASN